jgi:hypothetical protein
MNDPTLILTDDEKEILRTFLTKNKLKGRKFEDVVDEAFIVLPELRSDDPLHPVRQEVSQFVTEDFIWDEYQAMDNHPRSEEWTNDRIKYVFGG